MKVSCRYCGRVHDVGVVCERKPKRKQFRRYGTGEAIASFRRGGVWKNKSLSIRRRDMNCCRVCMEWGDRYGTYSGSRVTVDNLSVHHIDSLVEDYSRRLDDSNLITLCPYHHEMAEEGRISKEELREMAARSVDFSTPPGV